MPSQSFLHRRHFKMPKSARTVFVISQQPKVGFYFSIVIRKARNERFQMRPSIMATGGVLRRRWKETDKNWILQKTQKNFTRAPNRNHRSPSSDRCAQIKAFQSSFKIIHFVSSYLIGVKSAQLAKPQVLHGSVAPALRG